MNTRIKLMVKTWNTEGRAFSNLINNDTLFFEKIGIPPIEVGITSQTGSDLIYYNTKIYLSDTDAIRKISKDLIQYENIK